ncbi:thioredoxin family protein [Niveibacterium sp. 24ML]|uniref:thioredoxin family protein n=1 Tax=Niveibacterium sp. 24ML TaxID=2985512 RepID=UPI0022708E91|nr:thioredoxin fold domain-containing protein [Niveibacterium sp. 24ML]MCX9157298.1 thioredoxin family protein [Niveibacterium sp. 24ML]
MTLRVWRFAPLLLLAACSRSPDTPATPAPAAQSQPAVSGAAAVPWFKGNVDAAFAEAKRANKPLFLYWGAVWCPYCNQVKATLFNRADFAERARHFIPVELDGDSPQGQKLAARFKVRGYPTMILFSPDGLELTRLPGEVDAQRYLQVLALGMNANRPVKAVLADALAGKTLAPDDWRLLAYYAFDADEEQLIAKGRLAGTLAQLAAAVPPTEPELATRLALKALSAQAEVSPQPAPGDASGAGLLNHVLGDPALVRSHFDLLVANPAKMVTSLTVAGPERVLLATRWDAALAALAQDATLSTADRLVALGGRVALGELDGVSPVAVPAIKAQIQAADQATTNRYERQSVIYTAAGVLTEAGLLDDSDTLLAAELKRSHAPYYFMRMLGSNAKKRGDTASALKWYEAAWDTAKGGATRLQWGAGYVNGLLELAPDEVVKIEAAASKLLSEAANTPNAFYERNLGVLTRSAGKLAEWRKPGARAAAHDRLIAQGKALCERLPRDDPQRAACAGVFRPAKPG